MPMQSGMSQQTIVGISNAQLQQQYSGTRTTSTGFSSSGSAQMVGLPGQPARMVAIDGSFGGSSTTETVYVNDGLLPTGTIVQGEPKHKRIVRLTNSWRVTLLDDSTIELPFTTHPTEADVIVSL